MNLTSELYGKRINGNSHGDVFTSPRVVNFMLDLIGFTSDKDLSKFKILEPCFGIGDFLLEIQHRVILSSQQFQFDALTIMSQNVYGCEIDKVKYECCVEALKMSMPDFKPVNLKNEDFLFSSWDTDFNFIIGNPPYVRYENIPEETRVIYKSIFTTFHYRCDLYVLFYEHCLKNLAKNGRHCFICSNRWLKNEYGKKLRTLISMSYNLENVIDVEKLDAFQESVLAYPSITVISNNGNYIETKVGVINTMNELESPVHYCAKKIAGEDDWNSLFLEMDISMLSSIEQQGYKVGIGVATGADKLFISPELKGNVEEELLLPIINAKDLTGNKIKWRGSYLLNPYNPDGSLIDLNRYSKARIYLEKYRDPLERRHIVKKGRDWYSLIDKVKPHIKSLPKILLPDISGNNIIFVDKGFYYPAHNIYYITGKSREELELLAAILMSDFVKNQMKNVSNKMNGGFPRWQSQNIRKIRIPRISLISTENRCELSNAYLNHNISEINYIVNNIVDSQIRTLSKQKIGFFPKSLFDLSL